MFGCGTPQEDRTKTTIVQSENTLNETKEKTDNESSETESDTRDAGANIQDNEANGYPNSVKNCYVSYEEVLKNYFPQYTLSAIKENAVNDSKFFSFNINTNADNTQPEVTFQNDMSSFDVSLPDNIDNETTKNIILCSIMSADNTIDMNTASEFMQNLSNSFDGSSNSNVISTTNYKFYISADSGLISRCLNIISILEINSPINKEEYIQATNQLFNGELNQGTKVYIQGTILGIYDLGTHWGLKVNSGTDTYYVYYDFNNFIDCFEIDDTYTFYGEIAANNEACSGCLRLDYFSNEE